MRLSLQQVLGVFPGSWSAKFHDLPTFPSLPSYPEFDGDMAELHQLARQVVEAGLGDPLDDYDGWFRRYSLLRAAADSIVTYEIDPWPVYPTFTEMWAAA